MNNIRNRRGLSIAFALIMIAASAYAQSDGNPVLNKLFVKYRSSGNDTNRVRLLLQIDSQYLYRMPDTDNILDSALLMARQARDLSVALQFKQGFEDASFLLANSFAEKKDFLSANAVLNKTAGGLKVRIAIMLAERYTFRPGELKQNLDSALPYITEAIKLSTSMHSTAALSNSLCILGKYYFAYGKIDSGKQCFLRTISYYHRENNKEREANWWAELGRYMPHTDSTYNYVLYSLEQSLFLYHQINSKEEPHVIEDHAYLLMVHGDLDNSEAEYLKALQLRELFNKKNLYDDYLNIAKINLAKGKYNTALYYALAAKNNADSLHDEAMAGVIYSVLGDANKALGETDKSLQWYNASLLKLVDYKNEYTFTICAQIVHLILLKSNTNEALSFLSEFLKNNIPTRLIDKEIIAYCYGDCYMALKKYNIAEKYYLQMISLDGKVQSHSINTTQAERGNIITGSQAYYTVGKYYVEMKLYETAKPFLINAMQTKSFSPSLSLLSNIHLMLFKIDSAQANYLQAISHFEKYKSLNDTIFNVTKSRQIEELQIKYETNEKEKDIENLKLKENNQAKELQKSILSRNYSYVLLIALSLLFVGVYHRYRFKQKSNALLQRKQEEINQKNFALEHLVKEKDELINDKDILIEEKEWLLKEINHRIKNNLQIMISLLNTQSKYLDSREAIDAIAESKHRVQAMSLVHQKLYQFENTTFVNMQAYITEFVDYLKTCFNLDNTINFDLHIDIIELDVSQAIPVSLILNEAITNAIKYAFTNIEKGIIFIIMKHGIDDNVILEIHDNGKGLPPGFDVAKGDSMGIRLMKGLVKQIGGTMFLKSEQGMSIRIEFKKDIILKSLSAGEAPQVAAATS